MTREYNKEEGNRDWGARRQGKWAQGRKGIRGLGNGDWGKGKQALRRYGTRAKRKDGNGDRGIGKQALRHYGVRAQGKKTSVIRGTQLIYHYRQYGRTTEAGVWMFQFPVIGSARDPLSEPAGV
jgi:hypothetical protein